MTCPRNLRPTWTNLAMLQIVEAALPGSTHSPAGWEALCETLRLGTLGYKSCRASKGYVWFLCLPWAWERSPRTTPLPEDISWNPPFMATQSPSAMVSKGGQRGREVAEHSCSYVVNEGQSNSQDTPGPVCCSQLTSTLAQGIQAESLQWETSGPVSVYKGPRCPGTKQAG